jgi:tetratricopeptide (TPR) repeat protein
LTTSAALAQQPALDDAVAAYQAGKTDDAKRILTPYLEKHPKDTAALVLMGAVLDAAQKYEDAEPYYRRALDLAPGSPQVLNNAGNHYLAAGDRARARDLFLKTVAVDPRHDNANLQLATMGVEDKQGEASLAYLDRVSRELASEPAVRLLRARALALAGKCQESGSILEKFDASDASIQFAAGMAYADCKRYVEAETSFARALESDPKNFDILYNLGLSAFRAGDSDRAQSVLEIALREKPSDADTVLALAQVSAGLGFYEDSAAAYDRYLRLKPGDDAARRERGFDWARVNQTKLALKDLEWYVARHPRDATGYYELAVAHVLADRPKAISLLDKAVALDPALYQARYTRALLNIEQDNPAAAIVDLELYVKTQPNDAHALAYLGKAYLAANRASDAAAVLEKARSIDPHSSDAPTHRAGLIDYLSLQDPGNARRKLDLAAAIFHSQGPEAALHELDKTPAPQRKGDYYLLRAQILDAQGSVQAAADALNQAMRAEPARANLYYEATSFLLKHKLYKETLQLLDQASRVLPDDRELLLAQAVTLDLLRRADDCDALLSKIQARWPEWDRPYLLKGILLQIQLEPAQARRALDTAIALGANTPEAYYYQALSIMDSAPEDLGSAQTAITHALALSSNDPYIYLLAGKIALARKDYDAATARLLEATRLAPGLVPAHYALRDVYTALGNQSKASDELKTIKRISAETAGTGDAPVPFEDVLFTVHR